MTTPEIDAYHDARADAWAGVEVAAEDNAQRLQERVVELLIKPSERDENVWVAYFEYHDVDDEWFDDSLEELNQLPEDERDKEWHAIVTAFGDAALAQSYAEIMLVPVVSEMERGTVAVDKTLDTLTTGEIRKVGATGRARFDGAKKKRRNGKSTKDI